MESSGRDDAVLSWQHEWSCNFTSAIPLTYTVTGRLVESGSKVFEDTLTVVGNQTRSLPLHNMEQYVCRAINYSVAHFGKEKILNSIVHTLPECILLQYTIEWSIYTLSLCCLRSYLI